MGSSIMKIGEEGIRVAARIVLSGGVVVYPTDTVYGLGCDPFNMKAVSRVFRLKERSNKPLPVLGSNIEKLREICVFNERSLELAERFWPGMLTIVLPARVAVPAALKGDTIAVRVPGRKDTLELIETVGGLIVGTSANISNRPSAKTVFEAHSQLGKSVDLFLDGGDLSGVPSTVVNLVGGEAMILRRGALDLEEDSMSFDT